MISIVCSRGLPHSRSRSCVVPDSASTSKGRSGISAVHWFASSTIMWMKRNSLPSSGMMRLRRDRRTRQIVPCSASLIPRRSAALMTLLQRRRRIVTSQTAHASGLSSTSRSPCGGCSRVIRLRWMRGRWRSCGRQKNFLWQRRLRRGWGRYSPFPSLQRRSAISPCICSVHAA